MTWQVAGQAWGAWKAEDTESGGTRQQLLGHRLAQGHRTASPHGAAPGSSSHGGGHQAWPAKAPRKPAPEGKGARTLILLVPTVTKGLAQEELAATCSATASKVPIVKATVFPGAIMDVSRTIKQTEQ